MGMPNPALEALLPYTFPPLFLGVWFGAAAFIRSLGGFSWKTSGDFRGVKRAASAYLCSGRIAGMNFASALHLHRVEGGFLLEIPWIFCGGSRFVPDSDFGEIRESKSLFGKAIIDTNIGTDLFRLTGEGAVFYRKHAVLPTSLTSH